MRQRVYAIYDVKAEAPLGVLQWQSTDAQACRMFESIVAAQGTLVNEHPDDFILVCVGVLNFETMVFEPSPAPLAAPVAYGNVIARAFARARESSVAPALSVSE